MYEVGNFGAVSSTLFVAIGIYMAHTLYKSPRRWWQCILAWLGAGVLVAVLGDLFAIVLPQFSPERVNIFTGCAFVTAYLYLFPNLPLSQRIFTYFLIDSCQYLLVLLSRTVAMLMVGAFGADAQIAFAICYLICAAAFCVLYTLRLKGIIFRSLIAFQKNLLGLALFAAVCYLSTLLLIDVWAPWPALTAATALGHFALLFMNLGGYLLAFRTLTAVQDRNEVERDARYMAEQLALLERYYTGLVEQIEQTRILSHDLRHHAGAISVLCEEENWSAVRDYVSAFSNNLPRGLPQRYCSVSEVNAMLGYYAECCALEDIRFNCCIEFLPDTGIAPLHLCIILGNALENALEANRLITDSTARFIDLKVAHGQHYLALCVSNCFHGPLSTGENGQLSSTKKEPGHGLGLCSIRETAQRYDGWCTTKTEGNIFTLQVILNCPVSSAPLASNCG